MPPKDPYIKVRVLDDIGNVVLSDQLANLARHAILFLRRTDAEQYISQVIFLRNTGHIRNKCIHLFLILLLLALMTGLNGRTHKLTPGSMSYKVILIMHCF